MDNLEKAQLTAALVRFGRADKWDLMVHALMNNRDVLEALVSGLVGDAVRSDHFEPCVVDAVRSHPEAMNVVLKQFILTGASPHTPELGAAVLTAAPDHELTPEYRVFVDRAAITAQRSSYEAVAEQLSKGGVPCDTRRLRYAIRNLKQPRACNVIAAKNIPRALALLDAPSLPVPEAAVVIPKAPTGAMRGRLLNLRRAFSLEEFDSKAAQRALSLPYSQIQETITSLLGFGSLVKLKSGDYRLAASSDWQPLARLPVVIPSTSGITASPN